MFRIFSSINKRLLIVQLAVLKLVLRCPICYLSIVEGLYYPDLRGIQRRKLSKMMLLYIKPKCLFVNLQWHCKVLLPFKLVTACRQHGTICFCKIFQPFSVFKKLLFILNRQIHRTC